MGSIHQAFHARSEREKMWAMDKLLKELPSPSNSGYIPNSRCKRIVSLYQDALCTNPSADMSAFKKKLYSLVLGSFDENFEGLMALKTLKDMGFPVESEKIVEWAYRNIPNYGDKSFRRVDELFNDPKKLRHKVFGKESKKFVEIDPQRVAEEAYKIIRENPPFTASALEVLVYAEEKGVSVEVPSDIKLDNLKATIKVAIGGGSESLSWAHKLLSLADKFNIEINY